MENQKPIDRPLAAIKWLVIAVLAYLFLQIIRAVAA